MNLNRHIKLIRKKIYIMISQELLPKFLYHATPSSLYKQICEDWAILPNSDTKIWSTSKNVIYLAIDPWMAKSYVEVGLDIYFEENQSDLFASDEVVILEIPTASLDINSLEVDENNQSNYDGTFNEIMTYQYTNRIPISDTSIYN